MLISSSLDFPVGGWVLNPLFAPPLNFYFVCVIIIVIIWLFVIIRKFHNIHNCGLGVFNWGVV